MSEPIPFQPFRRNEEVRIYHSRGLPHWRQERATYFVTFRTADSMPASFRKEWIEERDDWLRRRGFDPTDEAWRKSVGDPMGGLAIEYAERSGERMDEWLDRGAGECLLRKPENAEIVENALRFYDGSQCRLGDFVVMPNHVHFLATPAEGEKLEEIVGAIKGFSGQRINEVAGRDGSFWQAGFYDHLVRSGDSLKRFREYIRDNPARARLERGDCAFGEAEYEIYG